MSSAINNASNIIPQQQPQILNPDIMDPPNGNDNIMIEEDNIEMLTHPNQLHAISSIPTCISTNINQVMPLCGSELLAMPVSTLTLSVSIFIFVV